MVATLRLLPEVSRRLTVRVVLLLLFTALLPATLAVFTGLLVGTTGSAVTGGWSSAAGRRLVAVIAALVVLFVLQQLSSPALRALSESLGRRVEGHLRGRVMEATLAPAGIAHLEDPDLADQVATAQAVGIGQTTVREAVVGLAMVGSNRLAGLLSAVVLTRYRWWLAAGLLAVYAGLTWVRARLLQGTVAALRGHARRFRRSSYFRDLALKPGAAKEVRVFGLSPWIGDRFAEAWGAAMAGFRSDRPRGWWLPPTAALVLGGTLCLTYALLGRSAARGEISLGELATFAGAATGVGILFTLGADNINISYGTASVPAALELERLVTDPRFALPGTRTAYGLPSSSIRFEGVTFRYPGQQDDVFTDFDLHIPAGKSLAIIGRNGSGKTTLVKLLARLYDPTAGRITVDGVDLATVEPRAWRSRMAAIFQDFVHYPLSAADNVRFGAVGHVSDREALAAAAERAGADEIVDRLPRGWPTVLSRRAKGGVDLSGGQWQRVALARALFAVDAGASVLILDEPTAALDVRAEAEFYDRFLELTRGLTTIVISHRFSTVRRADGIVVVEDGRVAEAGDHDSLMAAGGRYAHMFRLQAAHLGGDQGDQATRRPGRRRAGQQRGARRG